MKKLLRKIENLFWPILPIKWEYNDEGFGTKASVDYKALIHFIIFYAILFVWLSVPLLIIVLWLMGYEKWPWQ